jgi:Tol biopolymer transport system component
MNFDQSSSMKYLLTIFISSVALSNCFCQIKSDTVLPNVIDIGFPVIKGKSKFDPASQVYNMAATGQYSGLNREEMHFRYCRIGGDFLLTADFSFPNAETRSQLKTGWMIRESLGDDAPHVTALKQSDGQISIQWRNVRGAFIRDPQDLIISPKRGMQTLQLERIGKKVTMRAAGPGEPLQEIGSVSMADMPDSLVAGIFFCAQDNGKSDSSLVWNLRIDKPIADNYNPNPVVMRSQKKDESVLGSRLEVMNVFDGKRKIIHESKGRFEAPNWMPDGKKLLYNEGGYLYTLSLDGGAPVRFNTGQVNRNNNDHGISFDGKTLAISSHRDGLPGGGSTVYVLPITGGNPRMVNGNTPSYWHGWAPGSKEVVLVGQRNGSTIYNIYKVDVTTGKESDLTGNRSGHVDGPEYSPDGNFIYYNANPTGTMQLWRMKPDGSGKEQLTFDQYNNWFPHMSPDGKWIAFISFPSDIDPGSHPSYKKVMLRLMPVNGGAPRVIAHLYGGQGTLNVNSWSPDSKHIAFVSNSGKYE